MSPCLGEKIWSELSGDTKVFLKRRAPFLKMKGNVKERSTFRRLGRCKTWLYAGKALRLIGYRAGENSYGRSTSRKLRREYVVRV